MTGDHPQRPRGPPTGSPNRSSISASGQCAAWPFPVSKKVASESGFCGLSCAGQSAPAQGRTRPGPATPACPPPRGPSLFRVLWVEGDAQRPLWLYHQAPGDRARRSVLSRASTVRRLSWQASRASAADLLPGDKRLFSEAQVPQPARPSVMSQQLKSCTRQARGSTAAARPQLVLWPRQSFGNRGT